MKKDFGIKVEMPFYHLDGSDEVDITSKNITYSEINNCGYGIALNDYVDKEKIKKLCFDISAKVKELQNLIK